MGRKAIAGLSLALFAAAGPAGAAPVASISYSGAGKAALRVQLKSLGVPPQALRPWKTKSGAPHFPPPTESVSDHVEWHIDVTGRQVSATGKQVAFTPGRPQAGDTLRVSWTAPWKGHDWSAREKLVYREDSGWETTSLQISRLGINRPTAGAGRSVPNRLRRL